MKQYFKLQEFECKCNHPKCSRLPTDPDTLDRLEDLKDVLNNVRNILMVAMIVLSGWRCQYHPEEVKKSRPGKHFYGLAADISIYKWLPSQVSFMILLCGAFGIKGIGTAKTFVHLDMRDKFARWGYNSK